MATRRWISVPFEEKDDVKKIGGRWDPKARLWYVPDGYSMAPFEPWITFDWSTAPEVFVFYPTSQSGKKHCTKINNLPAISGRSQDIWEICLGGNDRVATCEMTRICWGELTESIMHGDDVSLATLIEHIRRAILNSQDLMLCHAMLWPLAMKHAATIPWIFKAHTAAATDQVFAPAVSP
jgi:hypothetical protein